MKKSERTKQFIIAQTAAIFNKKGFAGTSMADITGATGLTKGAIYGNFANKEEVALAAFAFNYGQIRKTVHVALQKAENTREKLLAYVDFYKEYYETIFQWGGCPILNVSSDSDDAHPLLFQKVKSALESWRNNLISIIEEGLSKGEVKPETNPDTFADMFISLIEGGILLSKSLGNNQSLLSNLELLKKQINMILI
jgi:TetR/AcrR family transcriptional regulator, transcriptional repressor for nem operon